MGRYILVAAAAVLLLAGGYRLGRDQHGGMTAATPAPAPAADPMAALEARAKAPDATAADWRSLAAAWFERDRFAEAARGYARAAALAPGDATSWSALGEAIVQRDKGIGDDAARAFHHALAIDRHDPRARYFLAVKQDIAGDHRGAVEAWLALLRDAPANAPWAGSVRALVEQVAAHEKIDIAGRLPPALSLSPADPGVAADAIPGPDAGQLRDAARLAPGEQDAMARAMVDRLAARLAANPRDAAGWMRLMRARLVLGDAAGARTALADARCAFASDTATLTRLDDTANTLGVPR